jgi:hypothetical protein
MKKHLREKEREKERNEKSPCQQVMMSYERLFFLKNQILELYRLGIILIVSNRSSI